ncbi:MAG: hypothetical protein ACKVHP_24420 [Verrucomicrobiales bacterium]
MGSLAFQRVVHGLNLFFKVGECLESTRTGQGTTAIGKKEAPDPCGHGCEMNGALIGVLAGAGEGIHQVENAIVRFPETGERFIDGFPEIAMDLLKLS